MKNSMTAEDALANGVDKMGKELGTTYHYLWQELAWLYSKWTEYVELYGTSESRVKLLNSVAPRLFRVVQDTLWEGIVLHIARMTDPPKTGRKSNLSVQQLPDLLKDAELIRDVGLKVEAALQASGFCRDWRNRHLAHRDWHLATGDGADPLPSASRQAVKDALYSLTAVLNAISEHYLKATTGFDLGGHARGAESLLYVLHAGVRHQDERERRFRKGEALPEDYRPTEI